mmetsp:Transcript_26686/g.53868  ORF Transcript_26686/g.53868 Transcript_26686/m.53868 type:complete len:122 (-) Transcript_26686:13-378(-)
MEMCGRSTSADRIECPCKNSFSVKISFLLHDGHRTVSGFMTHLWWFDRKKIVVLMLLPCCDHLLIGDDDNDDDLKRNTIIYNDQGVGLGQEIASCSVTPSDRWGGGSVKPVSVVVSNSVYA